MIPTKPGVAAEKKKKKKPHPRRHGLTFWAEACCMSVNIDDYDDYDDDHKRKKKKERPLTRLAIG